ncbi:MAG: DUF4293 domain-containing protein [Bacteroidota bacterium]
MIQRIQTLFFLLAAIGFGVLFFLPFATSDVAINGLFEDSIYQIGDHIALQLITALGVLLSVLAIFMYRHRSNQIKTGIGATTMAILLPIVAVLIYMNDPVTSSDTTIEDHAGLYVPIVVVVCALLAVRFVRKDDKLVKSMDRLR